MIIRKSLMIIPASIACFLASACGSGNTNPETNLQPAPKKHLKGYFRYRAWKGGSHLKAMTMAAAGSTIPLAEYSFVASKDNTTYSGEMVGTSPFAASLTGSTIPVVVVPLRIGIGSATFDASAPDPCDGNISALTRFQQSPLVNAVPNFTINGVNVGNTQFVDGFRRAEFWNTINGSPAYMNELTVTGASPYEITSATVGNHGIADGSGCSQLGVLSTDWLDSYLQGTVIPALTSSGVVSTKSAVFFLMQRVVQGESDPPSLSSNCCVLGYHSAVGSPFQTYGTIDWENSGQFDGVTDSSIASHEIAEWMDDPLTNNATPPWGNIGQVQGACQANWEVGDPLSGTLMPAITMSGRSYQMQELAFYSWFFNKPGAASAGTHNVFSSNGTFTAPAAACSN